MNNKKRLAAKILGISPYKVRFADGSLEEVKKAITRSDIRGLIAVGKIYADHTNHQSRAHARKIAQQKRKGRQKGRGTKKGSKYSIVSRKEQWINRIRVQREFLKELREKEMLTAQSYQMLRNKSKGGYFRNKRHIKLFLTEHNLIAQEKKNMQQKQNKKEGKK